MLEYKKDGWKAALALAPALLLMSVFTFWPIINAVIMAFLEDYSFGGMRSHPYARIVGGTYTGIGFKNFIVVFKDPLFWAALKNTSIMVFISVPVTVILGLGIAVGLNGIKKLQGFYQTIFFLPYITNTIALGLVFNSVFHVNYGLINNLFNLTGELAWIHSGTTWWRAMVVLMVYTIWNGLAFKIIVFLAGMQSIDKQYYQAAQVDATPRWRVFRRITVPLLSPMILYILITSFIGAFKAYSSVIAIFGTGTYGPTGDPDLLITVVGYIYNTLWASGTPFGKGAAASIILFMIILLITVVQMWASKKRVHY